MKTLYSNLFLNALIFKRYFRVFTIKFKTVEVILKLLLMIRSRKQTTNLFEYSEETIFYSNHNVKRKTDKQSTSITEHRFNRREHYDIQQRE